MNALTPLLPPPASATPGAMPGETTGATSNSHPRRRHGSPLVKLALIAALTLLAMSWFSHQVGHDSGWWGWNWPMSVTIDGDQVFNGNAADHISNLFGGVLGGLIALVVCLALVVAAVVFVPLLLLFIVCVVGFALLSALGLPLLVSVAALALVLSPLILGVMLVLWVLRAVFR